MTMSCLSTRRECANATVSGSNGEDDLAGRGPSLEGPVRLGGLGEGERAPHAEVEPSVLQAVEQHGGALGELLRRADEPGQRGARQEDPARAVEPLDVERRDLTRCAAEEDERAADGGRAQRGVEGVLPDPVVRDVDAPSVGEVADALPA